MKKYFFYIFFIYINLYAKNINDSKTIIIDAFNGKSYDVNICSPHHNNYNNQGNITNECRIYINRIEDVSIEVKEDLEKLKNSNNLNQNELKILKKRAEKLRITIKRLKNFNISMTEVLENFDNRFKIILSSIKSLDDKIEKLKYEKSISIGDISSLLTLLQNSDFEDKEMYIDFEWTFEFFKPYKDMYLFWGVSPMYTYSEVNYNTLDSKIEKVIDENFYTTALIGTKIGSRKKYMSLSIKHAFMRFNNSDDFNFVNSAMDTEKNPTFLSASISYVALSPFVLEAGYEYIWNFPAKKIIFNPYGDAIVKERDDIRQWFFKLKYFWK